MRYWHDQRTNEVVYEDGVRVAVSQAEARRILTPSSANYGDYLTQYQPQPQTPYPTVARSPPTSTPSYSSITTGQSASRTTYQTPVLPANIDSNSHTLSLGTVQTQTYVEDGIHCESRRDPRTGVLTLIATGPSQRITDPALLASGVRAHCLLSGTPGGNTEQLYSTFKIRTSAFFTVGRIFLVLWNQPIEDSGSDVTDVEASDTVDHNVSVGRRNERVLSKVRRFVVIRAGEHYCSALPVKTYGRRGLGKPGISKHNHAIIYTGRELPALHSDELPKRGELPIRTPGIRVEPDDVGKRLHSMSRVDFGKIYTVQHNVRVKPFGIVHNRSINDLTTLFSNVWHGHESSTRSSRAPAVDMPRLTSLDGQRRMPLRALNRAPSAGHVNKEDDDVEDDEDGGDEHGEHDPDQSIDSDDTDDQSVTSHHGTGNASYLRAQEILSEDEQMARNASSAMNRLRTKGYTTEEAFTVLMNRLQQNRNLSREVAYRLLLGWTNPSGVSSPRTSTVSRPTASGPTSQSIRVRDQQPTQPRTPPSLSQSQSSRTQFREQETPITPKRHQEHIPSISRSPQRGSDVADSIYPTAAHSQAHQTKTEGPKETYNQSVASTESQTTKDTIGHLIRSHNPQRATFYLDWNLVKFMTEICSSSQDLADILTVTHSGNGNYEAMTCRQYFEQHWPDSGALNMSSISLAVRSLTAAPKLFEVEMHDLSATFTLERTSLHVKVLGSTDAIVDIGEQLAWLRSACTPIPDSHDPFCPSLYTPMIAAAENLPAAQDARGEVSFEISSIRATHEGTGVSKDKSNCWYNLFVGISIADGIPTSPRDFGVSGLEIPLDIFMELGLVTGATILDNRLVLQSDMAIFVAVKKGATFVMWHVLLLEEPGEIPYEAVLRIEGNNATDLDCLSMSRHFVGWVEEVEINFGTRNASYDIQPALPSSIVTGSKLSIASLSFSITKIAGVSATFARTARERLKPEPALYDHKMDALQNRKVIIYDDISRQAWLVDAARTVLHLLQCSIRSSLPEGHELRGGNEFVFAEEAVTGNAATLLKTPEFYLKIIRYDYPSPTITFEHVDGVLKPKQTQELDAWTIKDEVLMIYDKLLKAIAYQHKIEAEPNIVIHELGPHKLPGWSFMDFAHNVDLQPRTITLESSTDGWSSLCKIIGSTVLIGSGFGNVIAPSNGDAYSPCPHWREMPKLKDYLAAPINLLQNVYQALGSSSNGWTLATTLRWHQCDKLFEQCGCTGDEQERACTRIQELRDSSRFYFAPRVRTPSHSIFTKHAAGAVIFARLSLFQRYLFISPWKGKERADSPATATQATDLPSVRLTPGTGRTFGSYPIYFWRTSQR